MIARFALLSSLAVVLAAPLACSDDGVAASGVDDPRGAAASSGTGPGQAGSSGSSGANGSSGSSGSGPNVTSSSSGSGVGPDGASATGYVGQHGALHVVGNEIHDAQDQAIQLRGMSLFWSQWASPFYNAQVVHTLATDWGATVVRAAIAVESGGYLENPAAEMARLETIVDAAVAEGIYVIVDWHDHNAHQHTAQAQTFFGAVATKYGNVPNVILEVWNEPESVSWSTVKTYAETTLATVRGAGARNLTIVGSPDWSTDAHLAADNPVADDNVAYTFHFYAGSHRQSYRDDALAALNKGVALFVTEWGTCESNGNGTVDTAESQRWIDFMAEHHVGWANWSLFDKNEACSALMPGSSPTGAWTDASLTASGRFVKSKIQ